MLVPIPWVPYFPGCRPNGVQDSSQPVAHGIGSLRANPERDNCESVGYLVREGTVVTIHSFAASRHLLPRLSFVDVRSFLPDRS